MKTITLTDNEVKALRLCLYAEYKIFRDRFGHAASHGDDYQDEYGEKIGLIIEKLENAAR